jgi:hypothetical protein
MAVSSTVSGSAPISGPAREAGPARRRAGALMLVVVCLIAVAAGVLRWAGTSPGYDPYGWLVWGYQTLRLHLDLGGAPSWKPFPWLFTTPYSLAGRDSLRLWELTAVAFALGGPIVAGSIVHRLVLSAGGRRAPALAGAAFAALGVLLIVRYTHYWLSSQSDPMLVTCVLLALELGLRRRHTAAYAFLWLASLGRPEAWPFIGLYGLWLWVRLPRLRAVVVGGWGLIAFAWFGIPVICGQPPLIAYSLAQHSPRMLHSDRVLGTIDRFRSLTFAPIKLAAAVGLVVAAHRRDRAVLLIAGGCALWVAFEVLFALQGLPADPRYMFEAAAAMIVVAGYGFAWLLWAGEPGGTRATTWQRPARIAGIVAALALLAAIVPDAIAQVRVERADLVAQRARTREFALLRATIQRLGGAHLILSCGDPTADVEFDSLLAWDLHVNVGSIGHRPAYMIAEPGVPVVLFTPLYNGWVVHTFHETPAQRRRCAGLERSYFVTEPGRAGGVLIRR